MQIRGNDTPHIPHSREARKGKIMSIHRGILLHVVFSTKYREPVLADAWRDDLFAFIGGNLKDRNEFDAVARRTINVNVN